MSFDDREWLFVLGPSGTELRLRAERFVGARGSPGRRLICEVEGVRLASEPLSREKAAELWEAFRSEQVELGIADA